MTENYDYGYDYDYDETNTDVAFVHFVYSAVIKLVHI